MFEELTMAPKKNAYFVFVEHFMKEEIKNGRKPENFKQLFQKLSPVWNGMSSDEKIYYKNEADKLNSHSEVKSSNHLDELFKTMHNNSNDFLAMKTNVKKMFELIPDEKQLLNKKFVLLHVNYHAHFGDQYYFPAEIALLEFSLLHGISRSYHQIIGISKIYPRGCAGGMREYSEETHKIACWEEHPDDYEKILLDILSFLTGEINNLADVNDSLDIPYIFTIESEVYADIMKAKSSLDRLYNTVFPHGKSIFKVGSLELLFLEIKKKMNLHLDVRSIKPEWSVDKILNSRMYEFGLGLGCMYHEVKEIAFNCSKARVIQWMSNICKHLNENTDLQLIPGKHVAITLNDGSKTIVENEDTSLNV